MNLNVLCDASVKQYYDGYQPGLDSGFDLYVPEDVVVPPHTTVKLNHRVKCEPESIHGYYLYARSSISKTPLICHNSVGVIDYGYRGDIIGAVHNISDVECVIEAGSRLFQLCGPDLKPINVEFVNRLSETERGNGGFGSTGN